MNGRGTAGLVAGLLALAGTAGLLWRSRADRQAVAELRAENATLRQELATMTDSLKQVVERLDRGAPTRQPLQSASASLEIVVRSLRQVKAHDLGCPSRLSLRQGQEALLELAAPDCFLEQMGEGRLAWRATLQLDPSHAGAGRPVEALAKADRLEAAIELIEPGSRVLEGKVVFTLNSAVRFEVPIPPQTTPEGGRVTAPVTKQALASLQ